MGHAKSTIVLCEDESHWLFVYRWLLERGVHRGEIRRIDLPAGRRAGTQHVLSSYSGEVREYRRRANNVQSRRLIVVIDADTSTVAARSAALDAELVKAGLPARGATERICFLIPRRNLETWLHVFHGNAANEEDDYKSLYDGDLKAEACSKGARAFEQWLQRPAAANDLPSLAASRPEVGRV